jgi:uncharacterized membrane protein YdjX (TVP38/TMEM64 family)
MKKRPVPWKWIAGLIALGVLLGAAWLALPLRDWSAVLEDRIEHMELVEGLAVFCTLHVAASLLLVPAWIFPLIAGAIFGFGWGLVAAVASATLGAVTAFLIARYVLRSPVEKLACRNPAFKAVDQAVAKEPWKVVALLRLSPVMPSGVKSYCLGLTCVDLASYAWATAVGMLPGLLLKVHIGDAGRGAFFEGGALKWALFAAGIAATLALTMIVGRKVRRKLNL